jgi:hypothetical protein
MKTTHPQLLVGPQIHSALCAEATQYHSAKVNRVNKVNKVSETVAHNQVWWWACASIPP